MIFSIKFLNTFLLMKIFRVLRRLFLYVYLCLVHISFVKLIYFYQTDGRGSQWPLREHGLCQHRTFGHRTLRLSGKQTHPFTSGQKFRELLRQIYETFITLSLKTLRFLKLKGSFWICYHWRLVLPKGKIIKYLFCMINYYSVIASKSWALAISKKLQSFSYNTNTQGGESSGLEGSKLD